MSSRFRPARASLLSLVVLASVATHGLDANRLVYLDGSDPFHAGTGFPRLTTPQWIGEPGVEVAVTLGIDDMSGTARYEDYLRPILDRLKRIDGRAPVSIFCNAIDPSDPRLQAWLREGLSLEVHTLSHPCPILARGDFAAAEKTVHGGVDLLNHVPGNAPVAFRTPCCDSIDSASPRLFTGLLAQTNAAGQFLRMDSSIAMILTTNDPSLPPNRLVEAGGTNRFRKYVPFPAFTTTIENYPYPYVHSGGIWEMPFVVPSDWESQNLQGNSHPKLVEDWTTALDLIALKQGTFNFIFHPANWSSPTQHVAFIDHAVATLGSKVRFLTYREAHERLTTHLLAGVPLRAPDGGDNGVRLIDLDGDGFQDVVIGNDSVRRTRLWTAASRKWVETGFPVALAATADPTRPALDRGNNVRFGIVHPGGEVSCMLNTDRVRGAWTFRGGQWLEDPDLLRGLELDGKPVLTGERGRDRGVRLRNVDGAGGCELLVSNESQAAVFGWDESGRTWKRLEFGLPPGTSIVNARGEDNGLRFADLNEDGFEDVLFSNEERHSIWLFVPEQFLGWTRGWNRKVLTGDAPAGNAPRDLPAFVRAGPHRDNGAWIHSRHVWWQNEDTAALPNLVDRRSFDQLLVGVLPAPKSPAESLASLRVPDGFEASLVAAEPLVRDPVALDWGADGRLWVVEMRDYPLGVDGNGRPGGVVKFLEDTDGDGKYDRATEFLRDLNFPTGVTPWRRGVLVSAAPEIFYAEDTDGDGVADLRTTLFRGFVEGNQQHRLNGFSLGLDGWIYGANGDSGGEITAVARLDGKPVAEGRPATSLRGRDFRFRPDTGEFEAVEGQTQYGRWRDDWGHWFGNANYAWLWNYPLPSRYLARNPHLAVRDLRTMLARYQGGNQVHPISRPLQRPNVVGEENTVTSANSPTPYRDDLFGPAFTNTVFISEPTENLVHREQIFPSGATLRSERAPGEADREFAASTDNWFRPVQTRTGPDGALYIADMYRLSIEHPEWIPKDLQARLDLRAGEDRGRIYRIAPAGTARRPVPRLDKLDTAGLVAAMQSPNGWQRDTAMRLLFERGDTAAAPALRRIVLESPEPKSRLQALCTLDIIGAADADTLRLALRDSHPAVRAHALRLNEPMLRPSPGNPTPDRRLIEALRDMAKDTSDEVVAQLAFSLGELRDPRAARILVDLVRSHPGDEVLLHAVLSSAVPHLGPMLGALALAGGGTVPAGLLERLLALATSLGDGRFVELGLDAVQRLDLDHEPTLVFQVLAGFLDANDRHSKPSKADRLRRFQPVFEKAATMAFTETQPIATRLQALRIVGRGPGTADDSWARLGDLLEARQPTALQQAALAALKRGGGGGVAEAFLSHWPSLSPALRGAAFAALMSRREWTVALLDAAESKRLAPLDFNPTIRQQLRQHPDPAIRTRATALFQAASSDRQRVIDGYASVRKLKGDAERGRVSFTKNCAACHQLRGEGFAVGPDLAAIGDKSPENLLVAILDPNRTVADPYLPYAAVTRSGTELTGIIAGESPNSVTLRMPNGLEETLLRSDLVSLGSMRQSLMPDGFETSLDTQAMADLISFIAGSESPPKVFAGNVPSTIAANALGILELPARTAEIHGATLVFEPGYGNLGYWQSSDDRAVWSLTVPKPGEYDIWLDWATPVASDRHSLRLTAGDHTTEIRIPGTTSWDVYRQERLGRIQLVAGPNRLVVQGVPPIREPILDLREVRLVPTGSAPGPFSRK